MGLEKHGQTWKEELRLWRGKLKGWKESGRWTRRLSERTPSSLDCAWESCNDCVVWGEREIPTKHEGGTDSRCVPNRNVVACGDFLKKRGVNDPSLMAAQVFRRAGGKSYLELMTIMVGLHERVAGSRVSDGGRMKSFDR